jgi:hypothetical protein
MIGLNPLRKKSAQQFCKVEYRLTYWREAQTAVNEPLFREFMKWKRQRQAKKPKNPVTLPSKTPGLPRVNQSAYNGYYSLAGIEK